MFNVQQTLARLARLACASLLLLSASVSAAPLYHVTIDTSSFGHTSAYLGLSFLSLADGTGASATISNLTGNLAGAPMMSGAASGSAPGPYLMTNAGGGADFMQGVTLGGIISFDVGFALGSGTDGTTLGWSLFDDTHYLGVEGDLGNFFLSPGAAPSGQLTFAVANAFSTVTQASAGNQAAPVTLPEPSGIALLMLGALCLFATARRSRV